MTPTLRYAKKKRHGDPEVTPDSYRIQTHVPHFNGFFVYVVREVTLRVNPFC
jgi:hypothetical protein